MNFLLDINVISEPKQKKPNAKVLRWLGAQEESKIYLSVLTVGEIRKGITRLDSGKKKTELERWLEKLRNRFARRLLPLSEKTFLVWGKMCGELENKGIVRSALNSLLEATALEHDLILVTRNVKNFQNSQATILNPWED